MGPESLPPPLYTAVVGRVGVGDAEVPCQAWTTKMPKAAQPNLNYTGKQIV